MSSLEEITLVKLESLVYHNQLLYGREVVVTLGAEDGVKAKRTEGVLTVVGVVSWC